MATLQSAVRLPTPDPDQLVDSPTTAPAKRKQPSFSRSPSPQRRPRSPSLHRRPAFRDVDAGRAAERERQQHMRMRDQDEPDKPLTEEEKQAKAKEEYQRLLNARSGGTYIPPARLRALQSQVTDKKSKEYQRMAWEALKKSINGLINKVNVSNIKHIVPELFAENLVRGRGLFCRSIMKAQAASLPFTPIYAAMAAIVNTKLPQVGELLMNRLIVQFRKAYKRNDKTVCLSSTTFIAHLCNQQVVHELLAAHMLQLLLSKPTDDSVEIAVGLTKEVGHHLEEMSGPIALLVFDQFRHILHEADIDKRTQYMIEVLFQVRKDKYKDNAAIKEELDLVEEEDQITHQPPGLDEALDTEDGLNIFKLDPDYEQNEEAYKKLKAEILGEGDGSDEEYETDDESETEEAKQEHQLEIQDQSNMDLTNLRRTIYLTINSSADFEECCHKLMKVNLPPGKESELPSMIIETCSQRPTYEKFYGLVGERFARLNRLWMDQFETQFMKYYDTIHRYETNRLRNIARFFGHILATDAIGWHVFAVVHMNEDETTSSSRIFIKILFQELSEAMGMKKLQERLREPVLQASYSGIFPTDDPRATRFSINYFTSIGMGAVTEDMREYLKNMPKPAPPALPAPARKLARSESVSSYSSYSSYTGSSRSYSSRSRSRSRTPPRQKQVPSKSAGPERGRARTRDRSYSDSRSRSRSRSPPRKSAAGSTRDARRRSPSRSVSYSRSRSPPRRRQIDGRGRSVSRSRSRTPPPRSRGGRRSPSRSVSRSPSPPARGRPARAASPPQRVNDRRRRNSSSEGSRSPSQSPYHGADGARGRGRASPPRQPPVRKERSLSPYSKRVALTRGGGGR